MRDPQIGDEIVITLHDGTRLYGKIERAEPPLDPMFRCPTCNDTWRTEAGAEACCHRDRGRRWR